MTAGARAPGWDDMIAAAWAAYCTASQAGDSDAFTGLPADWAGHPVSRIRDAYSADRAVGYADAYAREIAEQQAGGRQ